MNNIEAFLNNIEHRPWNLPNEKWQYYQEWNDAVFFHIEVKYDVLKSLLPQNLTLDSFENKYYISIVVFKMENIRPRNLPPLSFISDFYEVNVRTYVVENNKPGVYFLNIEAEKLLSAILAKKLSGLPYEKSTIKKSSKGYFNLNQKKKFHIKAEYTIEEKVNHKTDLDKWLTERYCLYLDKNNQIICFDIHHKEWELREIKFDKLSLNYHFKNLELNENSIHSSHYSPGVQVVSWKANIIK